MSYEEDEDGVDLVVAELEWSPQLDFVDWDDPNLSTEMTKRLKGVTEEDYDNEVKMWQDVLRSLPHYDEFAIRKEILHWQIGIPDKDDFNFETHATFYSLQCQYRVRLQEIMAVVNSHHEMLSQATKVLKEISVKLAHGTTKYDKDALAALSVAKFSMATSNARRLLTYLEAVLKNIEFAAYQMDRMMKDYQFMSRINQSMVNEGMSSIYTKGFIPTLPKLNDSAEIRTRNSRLNKSQ